MDKQHNNKKIWSVIKPVGIVISSFLVAIPIILGIIDIYEWVKSPTPELTANVEYREVNLPYGIKEAIDNTIKPMREILSETKQLSDIIRTNLYSYPDLFMQKSNGQYERIKIDKNHESVINQIKDKNYGSDIQKLVYDFIENRVFGDLFDLLRMKYIIVITVANNGDKMCSTVKIKLPKNDVVTINREGSSETEKVESTRLLSLGDIQPKENITISAWSAYPLEPSEIEDIRVTHSDGVGNVFLQMPGDDSIIRIYKYERIIAIAVLLILVALALSIFAVLILYKIDYIKIYRNNEDKDE